MKIKPTRTFTDEKGNWWIEFKKEDVKFMSEQFKTKEKKTPIKTLNKIYKKLQRWAAACPAETKWNGRNRQF